MHLCLMGQRQLDNLSYTVNAINGCGPQDVEPVSHIATTEKVCHYEKQNFNTNARVSQM